MIRKTFKDGSLYATESTGILNQLMFVRDQLNSMYSLGYEQRRDIANLLFLLESSFIEIKEGDLK